MGAMSEALRFDAGTVLRAGHPGSLEIGDGDIHGAR